jgi:hypothetical protein
LSLVTPRHSANEVLLTDTELDRQQSSIGNTVSAVNWRARGLVFRNETFFGWNARPFSRLAVTAVVDRAWPRYILRLFVPFFAVMSISLFILWAPHDILQNNHRAQMTFSALLALAALSFTFETSFPGAISMNSPIASMISTGYFYLPFVLTIDLLLVQERPALSRRFPYLLAEIRRNVRVTLPLLFLALCAISLFAISGPGER